MKDRHYLRYDGTETEQRLSGGQDRELRAVGRIHHALTRLDAARRQLSVELDAVRREVRHVETPKRIRQDFETFWDSGGATADAYKAWFYGGYKQPPAPVPQKKHMRLVASQSPRSLRLPEKPKPLHRERLDDDAGEDSA